MGGVLLGVSSALSRACPVATFAQPGEGKLWALLTIARIVLGSLARAQLSRR